MALAVLNQRDGKGFIHLGAGTPYPHYCTSLNLSEQNSENIDAF